MHELRPRPSKRSSIYSHQLAKVMTREEMTLFEWIFEDAYLVDIDLSSWIELIALYLVAPHAAERSPDGESLFIVEFVRARHWDLAFNYLTDEPVPGRSSHEPSVWRIDHFAAQAVEDGIQFTLWGAAKHPRLTVTCASVSIRETPRHLADQFFPGRLRTPYRFIRPSLDELARDR